MQSVFVLGGTGQIGRAVVERFLERGWDVTVAARNEKPLPDGVRFVRLDRAEELDCSADVIVDVVAYEREHAEQLLALRGKVGSLVVVSSAAVYADSQGRTLDAAATPDEFPLLPVPIPETQPTVEPGDATYSTKKRAIELALLEQDAIPATVLRPCAIYGIDSPLPRELYFVKRIVDGRRVVPLSYRGASRFHTTAARTLAELVVLSAERPGTRAVNCGDPETPTVLEIARAIASHFGHDWTEVLLPGAAVGDVGDNPWGVPRPFVIDMTMAELELRYRPVTRYATAVAPMCDWLVDTLRQGDWMERFPRAAQHFSSHFDYAAEDEFLRSVGT